MYVGFRDLDVSALLQCTRARKGYSLPLGEVAIVWQKDPDVDHKQVVELLREFVGELTQRVGDAPELGCRSMV